MKFKNLSIIAIVSLLFASCGDAELPVFEGDNSIASLVARTETSLDSLDKALIRTNLVSAFQGGGTSNTIFAPKNEAFALFLTSRGYRSIDQVPVAMLTDILKYHVITGNVLSSNLSNNQTITTLQGSTLSVTINPGAPILLRGLLPTSSSTFDALRYNWQCSNGVVHVIDKVLLYN